MSGIDVAVIVEKGGVWRDSKDNGWLLRTRLSDCGLRTGAGETGLGAHEKLWGLWAMSKTG